MNSEKVVGQRIVQVRKMTGEEVDRYMWYPRGSLTAIVLENGVILYPSEDEEGNGPGELFGYDPESNECFTLMC